MILVLCTVNCTIFHGACPLNQPFVLPDLCNRQCIVLVNRIHIRGCVATGATDLNCKAQMKCCCSAGCWRWQTCIWIQINNFSYRMSLHWYLNSSGRFKNSLSAVCLHCVHFRCVLALGGQAERIGGGAADAFRFLRLQWKMYNEISFALVGVIRK